MTHLQTVGVHDTIERHVGSNARRVDDGGRARRLMRRIHGGQPDALGELMEIYWPGLVRYGAAVTGGCDEAEDVAQCVFVAVWKRRRQWTESGSVAGYLFRIARNIAVEHTRYESVRARRRHDVLLLGSRPKSPLERAELSEFPAALATLWAHCHPADVRLSSSSASRGCASTTQPA